MKLQTMHMLDGEIQHRPTFGHTYDSNILFCPISNSKSLNSPTYFHWCLNNEPTSDHPSECTSGTHLCSNLQAINPSACFCQCLTNLCPTDLHVKGLVPCPFPRPHANHNHLSLFQYLNADSSTCLSCLGCLSHLACFSRLTLSLALRRHLSVRVR